MPGGEFRKNEAGEEVKNTRVRHTAALRRLEKRRDEVAFDASPSEEFESNLPEIDFLKRAGQPPEPAPAPEPEPRLKVVSRQRALWIVEQTLSHALGAGRPSLELRLRLTTSVRGLRKEHGLTQVAFLFRLELLEQTAGVTVEGFSLGPWQGVGLCLEQGAIMTPEPLWSAFQARPGKIRGRLRLRESGRNRLWDLPWTTEGLVPGPEPFPA